MGVKRLPTTLGGVLPHTGARRTDQENGDVSERSARAVATAPWKPTWT